MPEGDVMMRVPAIGSVFERRSSALPAQSRVVAGSAFVTAWLRARYAEVEEARQRAEVRGWIVKPAGLAGRFEIWMAELALAQSYAQLTEWLGLVAEDAVQSAPVPPARYWVGERGELGVRGMNAVELEAYGQRIRCERHTGPEGSAWAVSVDGVHRGLPFPATPSDMRDDVAQRALLLLCHEKLIRIPDAPWQWSVLDESGREWWGRVVGWEGGEGRKLLIRAADDPAEREHPWPEHRGLPTSADLRELLFGRSPEG